MTRRLLVASVLFVTTRKYHHIRIYCQHQLRYTRIGLVNALCSGASVIFVTWSSGWADTSHTGLLTADCLCVELLRASEDMTDILLMTTSRSCDEPRNYDRPTSNDNDNNNDDSDESSGVLPPEQTVCYASIQS